MGIRENFEHKADLTMAMGYEAADVTLAEREVLEQAIYDGLRGELLCKVPGATTRFLQCNSEQLGEIASIVIQHWDDKAESGRLIKQKFNTWMWDAAEEEAQTGRSS
jgi:hypothetical protein